MFLFLILLLMALFLRIYPFFDSNYPNLISKGGAKGPKSIIYGIVVEENNPLIIRRLWF